MLAAVHHAEVVAHRVGEPFGTLILALAVTVIEVALIVSMMLAGGPDKSALPRDTIFSAIMIICNGAVGLCLLAGGLKHHEQTFRLEGATSALAALIALATLSLVLPTFTTSAPAARSTPASQLAFAARRVARALGRLRVRADGPPPRLLPAAGGRRRRIAHAPPPSAAAAWTSFGLLLVALVAVVGLAKVLSPTIERGVAAAGAPPTVIGIVIALLVLLPETWAARPRRARRPPADEPQPRARLGAGEHRPDDPGGGARVGRCSTCRSQLGLAPKDLVLLALTFAVGAITLGTGRTNVMQGAVHLVIFAAFLFLALVP